MASSDVSCSENSFVAYFFNRGLVSLPQTNPRVCSCGKRSFFIGSQCLRLQCHRCKCLSNIDAACSRSRRPSLSVAPKSLHLRGLAQNQSSFILSSPGTYTNVVIWTTIEPCVGVVCACLPTLRPLLRKVSEHIGNKFFSDRSRTRLGHGIQLKPNYQEAQQKPFGRPSRWIDENLHFQPNKNVSRETAATSVMGGINCERDDTLPGGINVRHDVLIERTSK